MRVLSLFDGIACWYEALLRAWIKVDAYYASEIDKYAIQVAMKNHPDIIQVWDVTQLKGEDFKDIDLIIGGSPCQGFSMAWKMLNFNDPRSKLFFEFVRLVKEIKPKYFLLENVKMKKEFSDKISEIMWCEPIEINSALLSAQNRKRLYWTNISWVTQPEDKGILLKDILLDEVDEKYNLTESQIQTIQRNFWAKGKVLNNIDSLIEKQTFPSRINQIDGLDIKCPTLCTAMWTGGGNVPAIVSPLVSMTDGELRIRQATKQWYIVANEWDGISLAYPNSTTRRGRVTRQKSNTLTTQWESYVVQKVWDRDKNNRWVHTDKSYCLPANPMSDRWQMVVTWAAIRNQHTKNWVETQLNIRKDEKSNCVVWSYADKLNLCAWKIIRKLTPVECERLQTLPDNYTDWVSNTQRYKALWNGWTVDVIAHIFSFIK